MTTFPVQLDRQIAELLADMKRRIAILEQQVVQATSTGGGAPTGPAGGDLAGLYPNPVLAHRPIIEPVFSYTGVLAAYTGDYRWYNDTGRTLTFGTIRATTGVAPTGAAVIVDVLANGSTIFTTTANRPTIAVSTNTAVSGTPNTTTLAAGSYLTVAIAQVGSTTTGSDLTVQVTMT